MDSLDPANHFTLGSVNSSIGKKHGNAALVSEGLESCWIATTLDPKWILPWTEIGLILLDSSRAREAIEHLQGVRPECGPLDSRYHTALGAALRELGKYAESLEGFESALVRNPDDPAVLATAAIISLLADYRAKSNRYAKTARYMGASDELNHFLERIKAIKAATPQGGVTEGSAQDIAALDEAIQRNPKTLRPTCAEREPSSQRERMVGQFQTQALCSGLTPTIQLDTRLEPSFMSP